jgi:hypothetical protein
MPPTGVFEWAQGAKGARVCWVSIDVEGWRPRILIHRHPDGLLAPRGPPHCPVVGGPFAGPTERGNQAIGGDDGLLVVAMRAFMARVDLALLIIATWTAEPSKGAVHKAPDSLHPSIVLYGGG